MGRGHGRLPCLDPSRLRQAKWLYLPLVPLSLCSLSLHPSLSGVFLLLTETVARSARLRFGHGKARLASSFAPSSSPCPPAPPGRRNRRGRARAARAVPVFFTAGRPSPSRFRPPQASPVVASVSIASGVSSASSPSFFPLCLSLETPFVIGVAPPPHCPSPAALRCIPGSGAAPIWFVASR